MSASEQPEQARKDAAYPYYDLEACIKFAAHIKESAGARSGVKRSILAKQVGLAESTPSFFQRLSATKVFGIIDGWGIYNLTENGRKYFYPQSENDKQQALLSMFATPPAFALIVNRFDGDKLPTTDIMGNILHQEVGVPDSWKDRVAQMFNRSASFAGIIDNGGFLRYDAAVHTKQSAVLTGDIYSAPEMPLPAPKPDLTGISGLARAAAAMVTTSSGTIWSHGQIKVQTPESMSQELWEKLNAYVQILKPSKNE